MVAMYPFGPIRIHPSIRTVVIGGGTTKVRGWVAATFDAGAAAYCVKTAEQEDLAIG